MNIVVHADDFGVSEGVTDSILRCVDFGPVTSTSIIVNGTAFDYALAEYRKRTNLRLVCHLNLIEGKPITPPAELDLLTDKDGYFYHSFTSLWKLHLFGTAATRTLLHVPMEVAPLRHSRDADPSRVASSDGDRSPDN